jgi:hypothetical protein
LRGTAYLQARQSCLWNLVVLRGLKFTTLAGAAIAAAGLPLVNGAALAAETAVTCTNPASGASWKIAIDYEKGTVDSYPASIRDATISWHDASDGGNYTLDRKSGKLTVIVASSTGGYFLYDNCKLGD